MTNLKIPESEYKHRGCEVYRNSLRTRLMSLKTQGKVWGPAAGYEICRMSLKTSCVVEKSFVRAKRSKWLLQSLYDESKDQQNGLFCFKIHSTGFLTCPRYFTVTLLVPKQFIATPEPFCWSSDYSLVLYSHIASPENLPVLNGHHAGPQARHREFKSNLLVLDLLHIVHPLVPRLVSETSQLPCWLSKSS